MTPTSRRPLIRTRSLYLYLYLLAGLTTIPTLTICRLLTSIAYPGLPPPPCPPPSDRPTTTDDMAAGTALLLPTLSASASAVSSTSGPGPDASSTNNAASFLGLPLELRLEIYNYLLVDPSNGIPCPVTPPLSSSVQAMHHNAPVKSNVIKPSQFYLFYSAFGHPLPSHEAQARLYAAAASAATKPTSPAPTTVVFPAPHATAILRTSRQIHDEATPVLYTSHIFLTPPSSLLTHFPRLSAFHAPIQHAEHSPTLRRLITRYRIQLRLDVDPKFTRDDATRHFSGVDELEVDVRQASWRGVGPDHLRLFEGVRGVKKSARVVGSTGGFEGYARWLEGSMAAPKGARVKRWSGLMELGFDHVISEQANDEDDSDDADNGSETEGSEPASSVLSSSWGSTATTSSAMSSLMARR